MGDPSPGWGTDDPIPSGRLEELLADPGRQFTIALVSAAFVATLSATQLYLNWRANGVEAEYARLLLGEGVEWGLWALIVPAIVAIDARLERYGRARALAAHLVPALLWFALLNLALAVVTRFSDPLAAPSLGGAYLDRALMRLPSAQAVYFFIVAGVWLMKSWVRQERLRRGLLEAQLRNLRAQIQPHFLFNTLQVAGSLIRSDDREGAVRTIVGLSDLLRRSLRFEGEDEVPLTDEVSFLDTYLDIQRTRFGERLVVHIHIGPGLDSARVPFLLLQPLVENAIRHGLDLEAGPGRVDVRVRGEGPRLRIVVQDTGGAANGDRAGGLGLGLENIRGRLHALYGARQGFRIEGGSPSGTMVEIDIPLITDDDD